MLVPPLPWTSLNSGGLIMHGPSAVRTTQRLALARADKEGRLGTLFKGLNTLNALPWCVAALLGRTLLCWLASTRTLSGGRNTLNALP